MSVGSVATEPIRDVSPEALVAVLEGFSAPAVLLSPGYTILTANRAYLATWGDGPAVIGKTCHDVSHGSDRPCDQVGETCPLREARLAQQPRRALHIHHTSSGDQHVEVEVRPLLGSDGRVKYFIELLHAVGSGSVSPAKSGMVGRSAKFNEMLALVRRVARSSTAALLLGESGTGKELVAYAIHKESARSAAAFVPVECSGLTETLFESELFGHEKGAFTGAMARRIGLVEAARGGTLFLDEIGDVPLQLQVKLLRLLEAGSFRRVGGNENQHVDFRLVCATHRDLSAMVAAGTFRADLYYRISSFPIELPPLRDRVDDLPLLVGALLQRIPGGQGKHVSAAGLDYLANYDFPGNIRELRNLLERACLMADGELIDPDHFPTLQTRGEQEAAVEPAEIFPLADAERVYLAKVLEMWQGERTGLAEKLGISERTLFRKIRELKTHDVTHPSSR